MHLIYKLEENEEFDNYIERIKRCYRCVDKNFLHFLYEFNNIPEIIDLFLDENLSKFRWKKEKMAIKDIIQLESLFPDYLDDISKNPTNSIEVRGSQNSKYWETYGTWEEEIIILNNNRMILLEGHTRVGILKGLQNNLSDKYIPQKNHNVIFITT